ncbi:MAG TPA: SDR family NAD(P)-dependent oxidoreductase [Spirochaetia bacterium]|nr:SDR family NAD(P)-dependent oxidoreductase [Spirochaetia bacterium]
MKEKEKKTARTALVTGASRGIGKAIAAALATSGWEVTGTCRNPRKLSVEDRVPGVRYVPLDFSRKASVEALARKAGSFELLVNNAGSSAIGPVEETPLDRVRALFEGNFFGAVRLTQAALAGMRKRRRGTVLFIGSMASELPRPFMSFYAASKAALKAFVECLRLEVRGFGIRVAVVAPLSVATMTQQERAPVKSADYAETVARVKKIRDRMIMGGVDPQAVAETVLDVVGKRRPRAFTVTGHAAPIIGFLARHLPARTVERLSARQFKL